MNRRELLSTAGAAAVLGAGALPSSSARAASEAGSAKLLLPPDRLAAASADRLPLSWHKERMRALQTRLAAAGQDGILLTDSWNIIYFTGLFHVDTERMMLAFIPTGGDHPIWFHAAIDRDLVRTWWYEDGEMYFDWPDVAGAAPQEGKVMQGPTRDLWRWALTGLKRRGFAAKQLAADRELVPSAQQAVVEVLGAPMSSAAADCLFLRERKTPEELALCRRAYAYFDRIHIYARDLLLTHGTDLTDFELASAATKFGTDLILRDIKHDGGSHTAVGITVDISCRAGRITAYPHPNQFVYNKIERGQPLRVLGNVTIGGCGGGLDRSYMIAPRTAHMEKLWTVNRDSCLIEKDLLRKGSECADIALAIHEYQVKQGMQKYIYHRPAHGQGMEGHQSPYVALGDHTVLDTGMFLSVLPGLFDPETGIGSNVSDGFVIEPDGPALQMSRVPWSEQWMWVKI